MTKAILDTERGQELLEEERRRDGVQPAVFAQPEPTRRSSRERRCVRANLADYPAQEPSGEGIGEGAHAILLLMQGVLASLVNLMEQEPSSDRLGEGGLAGCQLGVQACLH